MYKYKPILQKIKRMYFKDELSNICDKKNIQQPGLDGFSVEFYRTFRDKLKYCLIKTYNKSYNENLLTYSQRSSILALLFKKGIHYYWIIFN